jgi:hypothetical protein
VILTANLLLDLARSLGGSMPEAGDSDLEFSSSVSPITQLESPLDNAAAPNITTPQNQTCQRNDFNSVIGGGGAASANMINLGKGLWEISVFIALCTNFVRTSAVLFPVHIRIDVGSNALYLNGMYEGGTVATPIQFQQETNTRVLLSQPSNQILYSISNNAAGQITLFSARVLCRKLL